MRQFFSSEPLSCSQSPWPSQAGSSAEPCCLCVGLGALQPRLSPAPCSFSSFSSFCSCRKEQELSRQQAVLGSQLGWGSPGSRRLRVMLDWALWWDELQQEMILLPRKPHQGKSWGTEGLSWELRALWHSTEPLCGTGMGTVTQGTCLCQCRWVRMGFILFHPGSGLVLWRRVWK